MFPPHPESIPLSPHLLARVIQMRRLYWMSLLFTLPSLLYGWLMVTWAGTALGFGLFLASAWTVISRLLPDDINARYRYPYSSKLVEDLHDVRVHAELSDSTLMSGEMPADGRCCSASDPQWEVGRVRCGACNSVLLGAARPDLGRPRIDGLFKGSLRLLLLDSRPMFNPDRE